MVFIEYNVDAPPGARIDRWWAAHGGGSVTLPLAMVDSGQQFTHGFLDFHNVYKGLVDAALARPPQAEIEAYAGRVGNHVRFFVKVKNLTLLTLSPANLATVHAIVYEEAHVQLTNRFGRTVASTPVASLAPNATGSFSLDTADLTGVDWNKLRFLVLVDYRPPGSSAYDMLQAALAQPMFFTQPETLTFMVDAADPPFPSMTIQLRGADNLSWTASESIPWMSLAPSSGSMADQPVAMVTKSALAAGWQQGTLTFTTTDGFFSDQMVVNAYYGSVWRSFLPVIGR